MNRKLVIGGLIVALMCLASTPTLAGNQPRTTLANDISGLYADKVSWADAVEKAKVNSTVSSFSTNSTYLVEFANKLDKLPHEDKKARNKLAKEQGMILYDEAAPISTLSNGSADYSFDPPTYAYDPVSYKLGFNGIGRWTNSTALYNDLNFGQVWGDIGGLDAFGLRLNNVDMRSRITDAWLSNYYKDGTQAGNTLYTAAYAESPGTNQYYWYFTFQDTYYSNASMVCSCWKNSAWVWGNFVSGTEAFAVYAHDYKSTDFSSVTFGIAGGANQAASGNLAFTFNATTNKWAVASTQTARLP